MPALKIKHLLKPASQSDAPARTSASELSPPNLIYQLSLVDELMVFGEENVIEVALTLISGQSLRLFDAETEDLRIGIRFFDYKADGSIGSQLSEFRCTSGPVTQNRSESRIYAANLGDYRPSGDCLMEIDLVAEGRFWLSSIGHESLHIPVVQRPVVLGRGDMDALRIRDSRALEKAFLKREKRYDAIIFSLLRELDNR